MSKPIESNDEPAIEVQRALLKNELAPYINTKFILERRMRAVAGLIEKNILKDEDKKPVLDELVKIEAWIAEYEAQISALGSE